MNNEKWSYEDAVRLKKWCLQIKKEGGVFGQLFQRQESQKLDVVYIGTNKRGYVEFSFRGAGIFSVDPDMDTVWGDAFKIRTGHDWDSPDLPEADLSKLPKVYGRYSDGCGALFHSLTNWLPNSENPIIEYGPLRVVPPSEIEAANRKEDE